MELSDMLFRLFLLLTSLNWGGIALAERCQRAHPDLAIESTSPLEKRFVVLMARDKGADSEMNAKLWSAFILDATRDHSFPAASLAQSYAWLAAAQGDAGQLDLALQTVHQGMRIADEIGANGVSVKPNLLTIQALIENNQDHNDLAVKDGNAALSLANQQFGEESAEFGYAHFALADAAYTRGQYDVSESHYAVATRLMVECLPENDTRVVTAMTTHAATLYHVGRLDEAVSEGQRAANRSLTNLPDTNAGTTLALSNLANLLRFSGRLSEAEAVLSKVLERQNRYQSDDWSARAAQVSNFAKIVDSLGRHSEAEAMWLQAESWFLRGSDKSDPTFSVYPLRYAAGAAEARGDIKVALARRLAAIAEMNKNAPTGHPMLAELQIEYASTLSRSGAHTPALRIAQPALAKMRASIADGNVKRIRLEIQYARILARVEGAAKGYEVAAHQVDQLSKQLLDTATSNGELVRLGPVMSSAFATIADLAFASHHDEEGFRALQLANLSDIVLVNANLAARAAARDPETAKAVRGLQDAVRQRQLLDTQRSYAAADGKPEDIKRIAAAISANDGQIVALVQDIDKRFPAYRALTRPMPVSLASFQSGLKPSEILLAPLPVEDGALAIAVTKDGLKWQKTSADRAHIITLVKRIRDAIDDATTGLHHPPHFDVAAASDLFAAVVPSQLRATFRSNPHLLYYSSGALATIPPALLVTTPGNASASLRQTAWLVKSHDSLVLPTLALSEVKPMPTSAGVRFLGIGAPLLAQIKVVPTRGLPFRSGVADLSAISHLPQLPNANAELRGIGEALGSHENVYLTGENANKLKLKSMPLDTFNIIAIATHGLVGGDFAGLNEPALVLTPPAIPSNDNDGMLTASEIAALHLNADWVILSACNSAGTSSEGTPAYGGLASAFVQAGTRSLLVSHWPVRDDAAAHLTVDSVKNASHGMSRAVALRKATLKLMNDPRIPNAIHPAIWAPFVLIGN